MKFAQCPHCYHTGNPISFLRYAPWSPYKCPSCGKRSEFSMKPMTILNAIFGAGIGGLSGWILEKSGWIGILITISVGLVILSCLLSLLIKLHPIKTKDNAEQDAVANL